MGAHWARGYIGKRWASDGAGPRAFSCWGLVRAIFLDRHGIELPVVAVGVDGPTQENVGAIFKAAHVASFRPLLGADAAEGDVLLMRGLGQLHVGYALQVGGRIKVLQSTSTRGVTCDSWNEATAGMQVELWRRAK